MYIDGILDKLLTTLKEKNLSYGNSFDNTVDKWGIETIGIRTDDKKSRIEQLLKNDVPEHDESVLDTLEDLAGYSVLSSRYIDTHYDTKEHNSEFNNFKGIIKNMRSTLTNEPMNTLVMITLNSSNVESKMIKIIEETKDDIDKMIKNNQIDGTLAGNLITLACMSVIFINYYLESGMACKGWENVWQK